MDLDLRGLRILDNSSFLGVVFLRAWGSGLGCWRAGLRARGFLFFAKRCGLSPAEQQQGPCPFKTKVHCMTGINPNP